MTAPETYLLNQTHVDMLKVVGCDRQKMEIDDIFLWLDNASAAR